MGSSQSTRKITVPNESAHIIKVSDSVIDRLKNVESPTAVPPKTSPDKPLITTNVPVTPAPAPLYGGTLTSLQVLQEKEKQLRENDAYWANRVRALENAQNTTTRLMEQEFARTVSAIETRLPKIPMKLSEAPCSDKKTRVLDCYRNNPKQILLCAKEVAEFADCVDRKRLTAA